MEPPRYIFVRWLNPFTRHQVNLRLLEAGQYLSNWQVRRLRENLVGPYMTEQYAIINYATNLPSGHEVKLVNRSRYYVGPNTLDQPQI
jgi:hypothetical protein